MPKIVFTDEKTTTQQSSRFQAKSSSKMNDIIKKISFGLIKTDKQAEVVKLVIIALGIIWFSFLFWGEKENVIEPPSQELINSPQPINR